MSTALEPRVSRRKMRAKIKPEKPEQKRCCPQHIVGRFLIFVHYNTESKPEILRWSKNALRESGNCVECFIENALRAELIVRFPEERFGNNAFVSVSGYGFEKLNDMLYAATTGNRLRANLHTFGGMA
jgi:hypothetical protein